MNLKFYKKKYWMYKKNQQNVNILYKKVNVIMKLDLNTLESLVLTQIVYFVTKL